MAEIRRLERIERFSKTELGELFFAYHNAAVSYWQNDQSKTVSDVQLRALNRNARKTGRAFIDKLMELANV
jgi:hypothetical protein